MVQRKITCFNAALVFKLLGLTAGLIGFPAAASGQITPSTGSTSTGTIVTPNCTSCSITGGVEAGRNLFHSFDRFSIPTNGSAIFRIQNNPALTNPDNIQVVFARVIGGEVTSIDGLLQVENNADLFLLNPSGLVVGENASLQVGGSFVGSTAQEIKFADGGAFGVRNTLLTVTAPIGLQLGRSPGQITVQGNGHSLFTNFDASINRDLRRVRSQGLVTNRTLALIGGDIVLDGGNLTAPGGQVVVSAGADGPVGIAANRWGYRFDDSDLADLKDIRLVNAASIDTSSANSGGRIQLRGRDIQLVDGSNLLANTLGTGVGGQVAIAADSLFMAGFALPPMASIPAAFPIPSGINVDIDPGGSAQSGELNLQVGTLRLEDGAQIAVEINSSEVDPSQRIAPEPRITVQEPIAVACEPLSGNELVITGRGGLPADPSQTIFNQSVWQDLRLTAIATPNSADRNSSDRNAAADDPDDSGNPDDPTEDHSSPESIQSRFALASREWVASPAQAGEPIEAQSWAVDADGHVVLLATQPTVRSTPQSTYQSTEQIVSAGSCRDYEG